MSDQYDAEDELIAAQLRHTVQLLRLEIEQLRREQAHRNEFVDHRLAGLETVSRDHETRLRSVQDGVTSFKVWSGLANGGSSLMAAVAFIKAWLGGG